MNDFAENSVFVEYDLAPEGDIKILEGDREKVRTVKGAESFVGWSGGTCVTNAVRDRQGRLAWLTNQQLQVFVHTGS